MPGMAGDWLDEAKFVGVFGLLTIAAVLLAMAAGLVVAASGAAVLWPAL